MRGAIGWLALASMCVSCGGDRPPRVRLPSAPNPIPAENAMPGDPDWNSDGFAVNREVEGYADATSVAPGGSLTVYASVQPDPAPITWDVYRLGYYGGIGARHLAGGGPVMVTPQPIPPPDPSTGRIECGWPAAFTVPIGADWTSGLYLVRLLSSQQHQALIPFVVREAVPAAPVLVVLPFNTLQAYNDWGGTSLYSNVTTSYTHDRAFEASYLRPYDQDDITASVTGRDRYFAAFVEGQGYPVAYVSDVDLDRTPALALGRWLLIIAGHSEYWSRPMRRALEDAIAAGSSLASFSGNEIYWQVRLGPSSTGGDRQTVVCYKQDARTYDPMFAAKPTVATVQWRADPVDDPENALLGNLYDERTATLGYAPLVVGPTDHWVFTGLDLAPGTVIPSLLGYEVDRRSANGAEPRGVVTVGGSPMFGEYNGLTEVDVTVYEPWPDSFVFGGGSIDWAQALGRPLLWDPRAQGIAANVFARALGTPPGAPPPLPLPSPAPPPMYAPATVTTIFRGAPLVRPVAVTELGGQLYVADDSGIVVQLADGAAQVVASGLGHPTGIAAGADGQLYVTESTGHDVVRVAPTGGVTPFVGNGSAGQSDGNGAAASFSSPRGLCAGADGALYVADGTDALVRRVTLAGDVTTVSHAGDVASAWTIGCGADGSLVVPDARELVLVSFAADGSAGIVAGTGQRGVIDGAAGDALLGGGAGVAVAPDRVVFAEAAAASVRELRNGQVRTLAGGATALPVDGTGAAAGIGMPAGIALLDDGAFAVVDLANAAVLRLVPSD